MLNPAELIKKYAVISPLTFKNTHGDELAISSSVYVFTPFDFRNMLDEIKEQVEDDMLTTLKEKLK